jgi:D-alanyl-D-alanine carboxypeptidase/D-alanyl-D-alanine-endopeptidase (penicillin-binding protein 4)
VTRRIVPLGVLALTAAVPAVVIGGVWQYAESNVAPPITTTTTIAPPEPVEALATPLLSFRRQPRPLATRVAAAEAEERYGERLATLSSGFGPSSCLRMEVGGDVIVDVNGDVPVIPASNQKLLVAAVALDVLGPDFRYRTELRAGAPVGGVVTGDLTLVGGGDPVLRPDGAPTIGRYPAFNTTSLDGLVDQLERIGVTTIDGDVIGESGRYDDEFRVPSWGDSITSGDAGPYDALLVDDGVIDNGNRGRIPARSAAVVFTELLRSRGIVVTGVAGNADGVDPTSSTLAVVESEPLSEIVVELLHTSDNNTAEMLVKEIGYQATGVGSRTAGLDVVRSRLAEWGVPLDGVVLDDGSGLSRDNRVTCAAIVGVLNGTPVSELLVELLPVAGRDGTLALQLLGTAAEANMRAKTGTLTDVKALSGVQPGGDGNPVTFALVLNAEAVDEPANHLRIWNELVGTIDDHPLAVEADIDRFGPR